jgi:prepilin-type N-terminal cleavage/methylation domain-containing protein
MPAKMNRRREGKGFTLIELMIVIAIIGILAAIAIPKFTQYRQRSYDSVANTDVKNMYTAAQAYFTDYPEGTVTTAKLVAYGYRQSTDVTPAVANGVIDSLTMTAAHSSGTKTFTVGPHGIVTF